MLSNNISPEINNCVCCLSEVSIPARLSCGHLIDLNCIGNWMMKHERNTCPLDRKQISKVTSLNLDPSNTVSLVIPGEFPMKFYATLDATIDSVTEVWSAYREESYRIIGKIGEASLTIDDIKFVNTSTGYYHGCFKLSENKEKSLREIPLTAGENYKATISVIIKG